MLSDVETIIERPGLRDVMPRAVEHGETSFVLARLPDGFWVVSVIIDDLPAARHLYRVTGPNGGVICEHARLSEVADFLTQHDPDVLVTCAP